MNVARVERSETRVLCLEPKEIPDYASFHPVMNALPGACFEPWDCGHPSRRRYAPPQDEDSHPLPHGEEAR
jgi:hypothetical protein